MSRCGFACPEEPLDGDYLHAITRARSARLAQLFTKCFKNELAKEPGLLRSIDDFVHDPGAFPQAWPTSIGMMRSSMLERPCDSERGMAAALSLAFERAELGRAVRAGATFSSPKAFRFRDSQLPAAIRIEIESDESEVRIELDGTRWQGAGQTLGRVQGILLAPTTLPDRLELVEQPEPERYGTAIDLIAEHAPSYLPWVRRVVRHIVPVRGLPEATTSSSFELLPGVVALSAESPSLCMADALVHEASHQHFYLLTQAGRVDDGSDSELYFSPGPRCERPIDKILLAYHAFANVLLFHRACRASGLLAATPLLEESYEESLRVLESALETTRALTPLGKSLFDPLSWRIRRKATPARMNSELSFVRP